MQRFNLPDITEIKIPRSYLQNLHNEDPLHQVLGTEASLAWLGKTIDDITKLNLTSYMIVVDDREPLISSESAMLQAVQQYISEHFKHLKSAGKKADSSQQTSSASMAAAAAAATVSTPAADHYSLSDAITAAAEATARATASASSQVAACIALTSAKDHSAHNTITADSTPAPLPDVPAAAAAAAADIETVIGATDETQLLARTDHSDSTDDNTYSDDDDYDDDDDEAATPSGPLAANAINQTDEAIILVIGSILKFDIWKSKGKGLLWYKLPTGIEAMLNLKSPTLTDFADTARKQLAEDKITRTGMTGRFYKMIVNLDQPGMNAATREVRLMKYAQKELVINAEIANSWSLGKVLLSDKDAATLCEIAAIENTPEAIAALAASTATADVDADAALQTGPRR